MADGLRMGLDPVAPLLVTILLLEEFDPSRMGLLIFLLLLTVTASNLPNISHKCSQVMLIVKTELQHKKQ